MKMRVICIRSLLLLVVALLLAACEHEAELKNEAGPSPETAASQQGAAFKVAHFALESATDGTIVDSNEYEGKVRLINFFATWCPPCKQEVPSLVALQKTFGAEGFSVIGLSVDQGGRDIVKQFVQRLSINYPVLMANDAVIYSFGGISGIPVSFLVGRDNTLLQRYYGYVDPEAVEADIRQAINDKG